MNRLSVLFLALVLCGFAASAPAAPRSFRVTVSGSGPAVVLIPGLACTGEVWAETVARYRDRHQLHVLTLAGFGGQPATTGPLLSTVRAELALYLREHQLGRPVIVGHSLGGFLALWLAATVPDEVGDIVVVDALPFLPAAQDPKATGEEIKRRAATMRDMLMKLPAEAFVAQNRAALATMITDPKNIAAVAGYSSRSDQRAVATAMFELMTTDLRPLLGSVRANTLVLAAGAAWGAEAVRQIYAAQYAGLAAHRLVIAEQARHFIMLDDPPFFFAQLDRALAAQAGR